MPSSSLGFLGYALGYIKLNIVSLDFKLSNIRAIVRKYAKLATMLLVATVVGTAFYFSPSREEAMNADRASCKKQCAPLAGAMKGTRQFPNASATERRNHERFAECVCH